MDRKMSCVFIHIIIYFRLLIVFRLKSISLPFISLRMCVVFHMPVSAATRCSMNSELLRFSVWFLSKYCTISSLAQTYVFRMWNGSLFLFSDQSSFFELLQKLFYFQKREKKIQFQSSFSNIKNGTGERDVISLVYK